MSKKTSSRPQDKKSPRAGKGGASYYKPEKKTKPKKKEYEKIIKTLYEELKRKDVLIEELREEQAVLLRTAFRTEARSKEMEDLIRERLGEKSMKK